MEPTDPMIPSVEVSGLEPMLSVGPRELLARSMLCDHKLWQNEEDTIGLEASGVIPSCGADFYNAAKLYLSLEREALLEERRILDLHFKTLSDKQLPEERRILDLHFKALNDKQ